MKRAYTLGSNVPAVVSALRQIPDGFDVDLKFERNSLVRIIRGRRRMAIVSTVGWDYSLRSGVLFGGIDRLATEQLRYVIRTLFFSASPRSFNTTLFNSRHSVSPNSNEADVEHVLKSMEPFLVTPLAVPLFAAKKFPRQSEFFRRWLSHHENLGGAYPNA